MGGLFIAVVMFFPNGLAGVTEAVRKNAGSWLEWLRSDRVAGNPVETTAAISAPGREGT
jgi:hypothetical protein